MTDENAPDPRNPKTEGQRPGPIPLRSNPPVEDAADVLNEYNERNPDGGARQVEEGTTGPAVDLQAAATNPTDAASGPTGPEAPPA